MNTTPFSAEKVLLAFQSLDFPSMETFLAIAQKAAEEKKKTLQYELQVNVARAVSEYNKYFGGIEIQGTNGERARIGKTFNCEEFGILKAE